MKVTAAVNNRSLPFRTIPPINISYPLNSELNYKVSIFQPHSLSTFHPPGGGGRREGGRSGMERSCSGTSLSARPSSPSSSAFRSLHRSIIEQLNSKSTGITVRYANRAKLSVIYIKEKNDELAYCLELRAFFFFASRLESHSSTLLFDMSTPAESSLCRSSERDVITLLSARSTALSQTAYLLFIPCY